MKLRTFYRGLIAHTIKVRDAYNLNYRAETVKRSSEKVTIKKVIGIL